MQFASVPWAARRVSHLWTFNLHYFDYAVDLAWAFRTTGDGRYLKQFEGLFLDWERSTRGGGGDAWEPYVISMRVVNLVYAGVILYGDLQPGFRESLFTSIDRQTRHLERRFEWHLLGNHLLKNLHAVALMGLVFDGADADRWRNGIASRLWKELDEQVLDDGGHFERSPMYHAIVLGDLLELLDLRRSCGQFLPPACQAISQKMLGALEMMSRADGELRLFNDSANGIAPGLPRLRKLARTVSDQPRVSPQRTWSLPDSGYYGTSRGRFALMIDCGAPGPRYQPGHAHCDLLSYELDFGGVSLVVDSGVGEYTPGPARAYSRSTRAHNTVMISDTEQSEMWAAFRVGSMARVVTAAPAMNENPAQPVFEGAYQPYAFHDAIHGRKFFLGDTDLRVVDCIAGDPNRSAVSFVHLHPDCRVEHAGGLFRIWRGEQEFVLDHFGFASAALVKGHDQPMQGWYMPEFGIKVSAPVIVLQLTRHLNKDFGYTIGVR